MRKLRIALAALAMTAASLALAAPAQAETAEAHCSTGVPFHEWELHAHATYYVEGASHYWTEASFMLGGAPAGFKSNVNWRLRNQTTGTQQDSNPTLASYNSPDSLHSNIWYTVPISVSVPDSYHEYMKFHGIFDVGNAPDPSCKAYTPSV